MSLSIFLPFIYLLFGVTLCKSQLDVKGPASALLTKVVIPLVIIYNLATYQQGLATVVVGVIAIMGIMAALGAYFTSDPIRNMCFFYLNIGWLGLPVATALFGDGAAAVFIAAYIGSTVFGNTVGAGMLDHGDGQRRWLRLLKSPPIISAAIGLALMPFGALIGHFFPPVYGVLKFLLGFIGMTILGIWLASSRISLRDVFNELRPAVYRAFTLFVLVAIFVLLCEQLAVQLVTKNVYAVFLICLLPPAANIVVLETYYRKTGHSAKLIAAGTCISVAAIFVYASLVHVMH